LLYKMQCRADVISRTAYVVVHLCPPGRALSVDSAATVQRDVVRARPVAQVCTTAEDRGGRRFSPP